MLRRNVFSGSIHFLYELGAAVTFHLKTADLAGGVLFEMIEPTLPFHIESFSVSA